MFHANMLRKYYERSEPVTEVGLLCCGSLQLLYSQVSDAESDAGVISQDEKDLLFPVSSVQTFRDAAVSPSLTDEQHQSVRSLVSEYSEIFTGVPGKTKLVGCAIDLIEDKPFRVKPYPVYLMQFKKQ